MYCFDDIDKRLLAALQKDAQLTSDQLGLSASQAGRRRQKLDTAAYITGYIARLVDTGLCASSSQPPFSRS